MKAKDIFKVEYDEKQKMFICEYIHNDEVVLFIDSENPSEDIYALLQEYIDEGKFKKYMSDLISGNLA